MNMKTTPSWMKTRTRRCVFDEANGMQQFDLHTDIWVEQGTASAQLRKTFSHLRALTELARLFDGKVVDVSSDSVIIELCAKPSRINSFMKLLKPFGILEASRTG